MKEAEETCRIGEVAELLKVETSALRFWEKEFSQLRPLRTAKGQRLYRKDDIELLKRIQHLLHDQGMTIEGARKVLNNPPKAEPATCQETGFPEGFGKMIEAELVAVRDLLAGGKKQ